MKHALTAFAVAAALSLAVAPASAGEPSPLAGGKALFEKTCANCHALERSLAKQADRAGWESTIKRMIAAGAPLDEAQSGQILGYLAAKSAFEIKCNSCHDLQRPLTAIKNPEQWQATVLRMAAMKPGQITDADAGAVALYLSLATPVKPAAPVLNVK